MTYGAFVKITNELEAAFAPLEAEVREATIQWAEARWQELSAWARSPEAEEFRRLRDGQRRYYDKLYNLAGGKSWYALLHGRDAAGRAEMAGKNADRVARSRRESIAKKLMNVGIQEVTDGKIVRTDDGFNGVFKVETDKGPKTVSIETIIAGGYNIQCRHLRVLVKVR